MKNNINVRRFEIVVYHVQFAFYCVYNPTFVNYIFNKKSESQFTIGQTYLSFILVFIFIIEIDKFDQLI